MSDTMISALTHPEYDVSVIDWEKFRLVMEGGTRFIDEYLVKFSADESDPDFQARKDIAPVAGFGAAALTDVKNAIFQRMDDITRTGGSQVYRDVVAGRSGGVDLEQATMNHFIGKAVLPELLCMGKIGVFVDMPVLPDLQTKSDANRVHPYFYTYKAEQIRNWVYEYPVEGIEFNKLLLEEHVYEYDDNYGLPQGSKRRFRLLTKEDGVVLVRFFDQSGTQIDMDGDPSDTTIELNIKHIPFVIFELNQSMLQNIANHQIALTNMESSDVNFVLKANFPFYTEQYSGKFASTHLKGNENAEGHESGDDIEVGVVQGRRYGAGLNPPEFIAPPAESLMASLEKQKNLKDDIRALVNLALSAVRPKFASAESKVMDERGLEAGLSFLGLVLEQGERQLSSLFSEYENDNEIPTIQYPERYSLKTEKQRIEEASALGDQMDVVPSKTFQKTIAKEIARILLDAKVSSEDMTKILQEIDVASVITSSAEDIHADIEKGILSLETAAVARGYDISEVAKSAADHAQRIARLAVAQSENAGARGVDDKSIDPDDAKIEKATSQDPDLNDRGKTPVRGEA